MEVSRTHNPVSAFLSRTVLRKPDWTLFLFLLLMMNVKLWVKLIALIWIYARRFNFRFGFSRRASRLPLFYPAAILIAVLNWLQYGLFRDGAYNLTLASGLLFWVFCILAIHQLRLSVDHTPEDSLHATLLLFFLLNILISISGLVRIIAETGAWNPYRFQGMYQKYFIGTGDYIRGLSFDTSTTNALISAFGVIYFLIRRSTPWMAACLVTMLLTGSNLTNVFLVTALVFFFILRSDRQQKSQILLCFFLLVVFLARVSPQNDHYFFASVKNILHIPDQDPAPKTDTAEQRHMARAAFYLDSLRKSWAAQPLPTINWVRPAMPEPDINSQPYQSRMDTTAWQRQLIAFTKQHYPDTPWFQKSHSSLPGKIIALEETARYLKTHPSRILTGAGAGNFSSKLAFRVTGLHIAGGYLPHHAYINPDFLENHLRLFLYYFTQHQDVHSVIHTPDSLLNQLAGEYGLAGLLCFVFFYLGWFPLRVSKTSMSLPLLIIMTGAFFTGYWFEQLSVVILFELLMLMDGKRHHGDALIQKIKPELP